jgi:hypothetical protein
VIAMKRRWVPATGLLLAGIFAAAGLAATQAAGATIRTLSIDAGTMAYHADASEDAICGKFIPDPGSEHNGTVNGKGTYIGSVNLPQGAVITTLRLSARDNDGDVGSYGYLLRKRMAPQAGLDGFNGYTVMATIHSEGASMDLRRFSTTSINAPNVDNAKFSYFAEVVNCTDTVDPIGVQVVYTTP